MIRKNSSLSNVMSLGLIFLSVCSFNLSAEGGPKKRAMEAPDSSPSEDSSSAGQPTKKQKLETQTVNKLHKCTFYGCNKAFNRNSALIRHTRSHTGETPFPCLHPGCDKAFNEKGNLIRHTRNHTGEKPFLCNHPGCEKAFSRSDKLDPHIRSHARNERSQTAVLDLLNPLSPIGLQNACSSFPNLKIQNGKIRFY